MSDKVVDAEQINIRDKQGRVRIVLGVEADGSCGIMMKDPEGRNCAGLVVDSLEKPCLLMIDKRQVPRATVGLHHDGSPLV